MRKRHPHWTPPDFHFAARISHAKEQFPKEAETLGPEIHQAAAGIFKGQTLFVNERQSAAHFYFENILVWET
jgi:hypothetical protein